MALRSKSPRTSRSRRVAALAALLVALTVPAARAHAPHDEVRELAISPTFAQDQTLFASVVLSDRRLFARSTDGGRSWHQYGRAFLAHTTSQFAFSPDFANDGTALVATLGGGIWRTTDRGDTWNASSLGLLDLQVSGIAVSPAFDLDGIALAATQMGVFRSTDGGQTWAAATTGVTESSITAIAFAPAGTARFTAFACGRTVHRSDDGGLTWTAVATFANTTETIAMSPAFQTDSTLGIGFGRFGNGVRYSTDGGGSWQSSNAGFTDLRVNELALTIDGTAFAVTNTHAYRTTGFGGSWIEVEAGLEPPSSLTTVHYTEIIPGPDFDTDGMVYLGAFEGVFRSNSAGTSWVQQDLYHQRLNRQLAFSPDFARDGLIYFHNFGGGVHLYRDTQPKASSGKQGGIAPGPGPGGSGGAPTGPISAPPSRRQPVAPTSATQWTALSTGQSSLWASALGISSGFARDRTVYAGYTTLYRSADEGQTWNVVVTPLAFGGNVVRSLTLSPNYPADSTALLGSDQLGMFRTTDKGQSWMTVAGGLPPSFSPEQFAFSPTFALDDTMFVCTRTTAVWRSTDGGDTWANTATGLPGPWARSIALSPQFATDGEAFVGMRIEGLFKTVDGGETWTDANLGLPIGVRNAVGSVVVSPDYATDRTVFACTLDDGVFRSTDAGATWTPVNAGLPGDASFSMAISPAFTTDRTLVLSTYDWAWITRDAGQSWSRLPGFIRVNERHPTVFSSGGNWVVKNSLQNLGGEFLVSETSGSEQTFEFYGDSITWYANLTGDAGIANVSLDGGAPVSVDLYAPASQAQAAVFTRSFAQTGWHVIRILVTGTKNPASTGIAIRSDGFSRTF